MNFPGRRFRRRRSWIWSDARSFGLIVCLCTNGGFLSCKLRATEIIVLIRGRSCVIKGQSPRNLVSLAQDTIQRQVLFDKIAPDLVQKLKCQDIVGRCSEAVLENGVRAMSLGQELALEILLRKYEGEVDDIALQAVGLFLTGISLSIAHPLTLVYLLQTTRGMTFSFVVWQSTVFISTRIKPWSPVDVFHVLLPPLAT